MVQDLKTHGSAVLRNVLVTGANGFVGMTLCKALRKQGCNVRRAVRSLDGTQTCPDDVAVGNIGLDPRWDRALTGIDAVIHLAARAHVMHDDVADPLMEYRRVNVIGTRALAQAAGVAGVRRLIFLSSIKVNGEETTHRPFTEQDAPNPQDAYGVSKLEAERALNAAAAGTETVVLRAPLLYGPGVKGNFLRLLRAVDRGTPLPLASIRNRRSLLYVDNLVDAIVACLDHPAAASQSYLLADDDDMSTPDLVRAIAAALGKPARLLPFPRSLLKLAGAAVGKSAAVSRLVGSLQIDSGKIRRELGWRPRYNLTEGLRETAGWYYRQLAADTRT